jgi:hypothetical protein
MVFLSTEARHRPEPSKWSPSPRRPSVRRPASLSASAAGRRRLTAWLAWALRGGRDGRTGTSSSPAAGTRATR